MINIYFHHNHSNVPIFHSMSHTKLLHFLQINASLTKFKLYIRLHGLKEGEHYMFWFLFRFSNCFFILFSFKNQNLTLEIDICNTSLLFWIGVWISFLQRIVIFCAFPILLTVILIVALEIFML